MQHFYTRFSVLFSNLRTAVAQVLRTRHSIPVHSLRAVFLLCTLAFSCAAWGELTSYHTPGIYTTTWKQNLTTYQNQEYEIYGFSSTKSDQNYIWAGTSTTSGDNIVLSFATTTAVEKDWISNKVNGRGSSISNKSADEFKLSGYNMNYRNNSELIIQVEGYDQFSMYGKDNSTTKAFVVTIDGNTVTTGTSTTENVRRYDISTSKHIIKVTATGTSNCALNGFSLRLPSCTAPTITTQPVSASYSVGATATPLQVAATGDGTLAYQWQSSTDGIIFADIAGETRDTYTPPTDKAGVSYYRCIVSSGSCSTTSASATITVAADNTVYLRPTNLWNADNARFAVYYWDGANNTGWADMTRISDCEEVYTASIPANYANIIFCRMDPTATENNWDNKWNQTGNLTIENEQVYTISTTEGAGSWSVYTPVECVDYWYVSGEFPNHNFDLEYRFTDNQVAIPLAANTTYEFKIQHKVGDNHTWYGNNGKMTSTNCTGWNFYTDANNAKITTTVAGTYIFTLNNTTPNISVTYPALYTIQYAANMPTAWGKEVPFYAADIPAETASVGYGASYTLSANTPAINVEEGSDYAIYTFAGWNTQADGTGTAYQAGATIENVSGDITLYAQWTPRPFNITYYDDDQTTAFALTPDTYTYPVSTTFPTPVKQGYSFLGWKTSTDATAYITKTDGYYGDFKLYAEWEKETVLYTDTYIWKKQSSATGCIDNPNTTANANQNEAFTEKTYSSSTIGGGTSMGRPKAVGEYSITIAARSGYLIKSICTYGKVETTSQISWNNGQTWEELAVYTEQKKEFTAPAGGAASFIIKCTTTKSGEGGIWWRNALVTLLDGPACTTPVFEWVNAPKNSRVQDADFEMSTTSNSDGAVIYQSNNNNVATIVDGNKLHFVGEGTVTITAILAAVDTYCDATISATIDVVDQCGESSVIYTLPVGKDVAALATAETAETTDGLTADKAITAAGITLGTSGNTRDGEGLTVSISNTSTLDKDKYLSFAYTVADGKCFTPCDVLLKVQPINKACSFLIEMTDGTYTLSETTTSLAASKVHEIRFNNPDNISFCGQVELKIYSYEATSGYRLGTPIRILGTLGTTVTATINPDGGTIPDAAASGWILQSDGTYTKQIPQGSNLTMPSITRNGYTLTAYHDHNSDIYYPGNTFPLPKDYTFTAQWRAVTPDGSVTVTLDPNGGVLTDETGWTAQLDGTYIQTMKKGSDFSLPQISRSGYRFLYYTDETNDDFYPSETFALNADYVFTAQWCSSTINLSLQWSAETWTYGNGSAPTLTTEGLPDDAQIKYVSSNTAVAVISDDGTEIKVFMEGETEITAIYDGDEDYCPARASYILKVECNDPTPLIVGEGVLTGCNNSITLHVVQQSDKSDYPATGYTFQWYKDGQPIANATAATYTTQTVGEYFVVVHGSLCYAQSVNTAKITSQSATSEVTALTRFQYYRPGHTYTDNANTRHLFAYRSAGSDTHRCDLTAVRKRAGATDEAITDLSFLHTVSASDANGCDTITVLLNEIPADIDLKAGDTLTVTLTPYDNCDAPATAYARSVNIFIVSKPALAFIISGADSYTRDKEKHKLHGDFLTGINKADLCKQSGINWAESDKQTELPLYTALKDAFEVVPVNGYAAFSLLNYEPFDIVMLTDFPKTDAINKKTHPAYGVLDSLAYLVDYRPMFSLKGHMAKKELKTWASKGFIADPATPSVNPQSDMTVLCYAHGIFDGLPEKASGTGTTKDDSLKNIIRDTDGNIIVRITDGGGYNKKKALQGFVAVDANNFVNIAIIPDGKNGSLVTCCERQTNINARLLLLSVNADATSKITSIGEQAIIKGLHYLLETDAANVSDCSVTFHNQNGTGDHLWTTAANWSTGRLPLKEQNIQIVENCIVNTIDATAANILIEEGSTLTINSNAALKTTGKIKQMAADNHSNISALTNPDVITIKADENATGSLIHTTADDEALAATVQLYSKAHLDIVDGKKKKYWQYIGIPVQEAPIPYYFHGAYTYLYTEQAGGWTRQFDGTSLYGDFSGYATSQPQPETFVLKGNLASATDRRIRLTNTADGGQGSNLIGNSWTAPIRIDQMQTSDFNGADATIYIYNTGRDNVEDNPSYVEGSTTAGQWMAIPVNLAATTEWKGLHVIPAMQAFQVNTGEETELVLNYNRLVRSSTTEDINAPLRAPKRADNGLSVMRIRVSDSSTHTDLYLAQHPFFTDEFDNGWDAAFEEGDGRSASLYAITPVGEMAVAAQPQTDGTTLGFVHGRETKYTFSFGYSGEMLYLNDTKQQRSTLITDWNTYTFTASDGDEINRFYISSTPIDVQTPTGIANLTATDGGLRLSNPAHEDLQIGIYDAAGRLCAILHTAAAMTDIALPATQGVYLIHINGENTRIVRKVTR